MKINKQKEAFTLIELSVVLLVMGLLTTGFLSARKIIASASAQKIVSTVNRIDKAYSLFYDAYGALPGQMTSATPCNESGLQALSSETNVCVSGTLQDSVENFGTRNSVKRIPFVLNVSSDPKKMLNANIVASGGALALTGFLNKEDVRYPKFHAYTFVSPFADRSTLIEGAFSYNSAYNQAILSGLDENTMFIPSSWAARGTGTMNGGSVYTAMWNIDGFMHNSNTTAKNFIFENSNVTLPKNAITLTRIRETDATICGDAMGYVCKALEGAVTVDVARTIATKISNGKPWNNKMLAIKPSANAGVGVCIDSTLNSSFNPDTNDFVKTNTSNNKNGCALVFFIADI